MDGTGEQREEFGRRREPNTISWGVQESSCGGRNEFPPCRSMGIFQIPGAAGGAQLGDFTTSLPPSAIPAPGSHSRQGICCWSCAAALLSHTHTHRENSSTTAALGMASPQERHRQEKSHLPSKCCSSFQVFFQVIPTAQASKERILTLQCPPCPGSAPPDTRLATKRGRSSTRSPTVSCKTTTSEQGLQKLPEISPNLPLAWVGRDLKAHLIPPLPWLGTPPTIPGVLQSLHRRTALLPDSPGSAQGTMWSRHEAPFHRQSGMLQLFQEEHQAFLAISAGRASLSPKVPKVPQNLQVFLGQSRDSSHGTTSTESTETTPRTAGIPWSSGQRQLLWHHMDQNYPKCPKICRNSLEFWAETAPVATHALEEEISHFQESH